MKSSGEHRNEVISSAPISDSKVVIYRFLERSLYGLRINRSGIYTFISNKLSVVVFSIVTGVFIPMC